LLLDGLCSPNGQAIERFAKVHTRQTIEKVKWSAVSRDGGRSGGAGGLRPGLARSEATRTSLLLLRAPAQHSESQISICASLLARRCRFSSRLVWARPAVGKRSCSAELGGSQTLRSIFKKKPRSYKTTPRYSLHWRGGLSPSRGSTLSDQGGVSSEKCGPTSE
jgi:hypothetical protein